MRLDNLIVDGLFFFDRPVCLPARDLPRGLIAIVGPNGEGKTALVEATMAGPYREFPSKPGPLPTFATRRDSSIEVDWTLDTVGPLRARLNIDAISRKVDATLSQQVDGVWRPLNERGQVSTFDPLVRQLFPSLNVMLATAFASQNRRGSFSDLGQADRKALFAELLGLGQYERWAAGCEEVLRAINRRRAELLPWVMRLRTDTMDTVVQAMAAAVSSTTAELAAAVAELDASTAALQAADAAVSTAREGAAAAAARQLDRATWTARRQQALADQQAVIAERVQTLQAAQQTRVRLQERLATALGALAAQVASIETDAVITAATAHAIAAVRDRGQTEIADLRERIKNNAKLQADEATVRAAAAALDALEADVRTATADVEARTAAVDAADADLTARRRTLQTESGWPDRLAVAERSAALITRVPFGVKCAEAGCEFVAAAREAEASLPACRAGVARHAAAVAAVTAAETHKASCLTAREAATRQVAALRVTITRDHAKTRDRVAKLAAAADLIAERTQQIAQVEVRIAEDIRGIETGAADRRARATEQRTHAAAAQVRLEAEAQTDREHAETTLTNVLEGLQQREQAAQAATAAAAAALEALLPTAPADLVAAERLTAAETDAATATARRHAAADRHGAARGAQTAAAARAAELASRQAEAARAEAAMVELATVETSWRFLAGAFGRDGLPNLEIDAAGPIITDLTNDFLRTGFGEQRFTIEIVTQQAKVKGGMKESFELLVYDGRAAGKPRELAHLSGGQRVIVDEAVKCALAIYMNDRTRAKLRTCFRDETTGALYADFIPPYIEMLRRVQQRGSFEQLYFCTHNPTAAAMADAQLVVDKGTVTIRLPPYDLEPAPPWTVVPR